MKTIGGTHMTVRLRAVTCLAVLAALAALGGLACEGPGVLSGENVLHAQNAITVNDNNLSPTSLTIQAGQSVTFSWFGNNTFAHQLQVTGGGGFNQTSPKQTVGSWVVTFPAGVYMVVDLTRQSHTATITAIIKG
jgi:plastocyanin